MPAQLARFDGGPYYVRMQVWDPALGRNRWRRIHSVERVMWLTGKLHIYQVRSVNHNGQSRLLWWLRCDCCVVSYRGAVVSVATSFTSIIKSAVRHARVFHNVTL